MNKFPINKESLSKHLNGEVLRFKFSGNYIVIQYKDEIGYHVLTTDDILDEFAGGCSTFETLEDSNKEYDEI